MEVPVVHAKEHAKYIATVATVMLVVKCRVQTVVKVVAIRRVQDYVPIIVLPLVHKVAKATVVAVVKTVAAIVAKVHVTAGVLVGAKLLVV